MAIIKNLAVLIAGMNSPILTDEEHCAYNCPYLHANEYCKTLEDCNLFGFLLEVDDNCDMLRCKKCIEVWSND